MVIFLVQGTQNSPYHQCLCLTGSLKLARIRVRLVKVLIIAELDIKDNLWFFDCHFKKDPVMPGCLGLDAMWQLVGFYLGWLGNPGRGRALGVNTVKFTGEVLKNVKKAVYELSLIHI